MANARSIEVKVGFLILTAIGLLVAFILVMGSINFQPTYSILVDFDNPGGLQGGAPVKIAGVRVGKIEEIEFRGGNVDAQGKRDALVRVKISVEKRYQKSVHENGLFYVTTQGVLGEQFLAIEPGSADRPVLQDGAVVRGLDPPRLDMLLAEGYELLHSTVTSIRENRAEIRDTFDGLRATLKGTGTFFTNNGERLDKIVVNVEEATVSGNELIKGANEKFVQNPQVDRILTNTDALTGQLAHETPELMADAKSTMKNAKRFSDTIGSEEQQVKIKRLVDDTTDLVGRAKVATNDAQQIISHVKQGRGTVGALVMDEQLFDDLQELARDLKHNPWKFFWRE
jgi:phospholipid/cholesterol/gamma-HCH transport system substrate-binding protein